MVIIWSNFAASTLNDIYNYYKEIAGEKIAKKIKSNILNPQNSFLSILNLDK